MPAPPHPRGALIHVDPAVMAGCPVFVGTRVPIDIVLACIDAGDAMERVQASYPFVSPDHIAAARAWIELNERQPQPPASADQAVSGNDFDPPTPERPLLMHEAFSKMRKLRLLRASVKQQESTARRCKIYVEDKSGETVVGTMTPPIGNPSSTFDVFIGWRGTEKETMPTLLQVRKLTSPWDQRLLCLLAMGETAIETFPSLAGGQWSVARLTMPDFDGSAEQDTVTVIIDTAGWVATLSSTSPARKAAELLVPGELRQESVGALLVEMSSRLLLGKSGWAS